MEIVVITGLSGAGKSQALHLIEDIDYYCVDNMPPELIPVFIELCRKSDTPMTRVAVGVDVRSKGNFTELLELIKTLRRDPDVDCKVLFCDAAAEVLIRRYKESRRPHPLEGKVEGTIEEAIAYARRMLLPMYDVSDFIVDTSHTTIGQLRSLLSAYLLGKIRETAVKLISFGYKNGLPPECDMVFDMRALPNPFYMEQLKDLTGRDKPVMDYVFSFPQTEEYVDKIEQMILSLLPLFNKEGRATLVVGIGCTGGKHRSVAVAERLGADLQLGGRTVKIHHRDSRENL